MPWRCQITKSSKMWIKALGLWPMKYNLSRFYYFLPGFLGKFLIFVSLNCSHFKDAYKAYLLQGLNEKINVQYVELLRLPLPFLTQPFPSISCLLQPPSTYSCSVHCPPLLIHYLTFHWSWNPVLT